MSLQIPRLPILNVLAAAALLSACSVLSQFRPSAHLATCPPPPGIALSSNQAMRYYTCLGTLADADINKEYQATNRSFATTGSDSDRVKLAMLLSLPNTSFQSIAEALKLLQDPPANPASPPPALHNLARMLNMMLTEQQRESDTSNDLARALAAEKAHSEFLQGKIDAVKNLEINMIHRDQP